MPVDDGIFRIMISTDNHLGYMEKDPVRADDSFAAFEEVFINAKKRKADFVLFAGDMFHDNKPSRRTMHSAMKICKKYCLGDDPVYTEILNLEDDMFAGGGGAAGRGVNYEDPHIAVSLPVFSIHGNHDDPSREGTSGDALSALDVLSVSNYVNYFGKQEKVDYIEISPILMKKGDCYIALYGLGAIRDERLNRTWNDRKVKFVRPSTDKNLYFNIFVLHQNRDYGRGKKNCVHESMIPEWMDLVIWGNEHERLKGPQASLVGSYHILQPGSSIATSLVEGESSTCSKGMDLLQVKKDKQFRTIPIPFTQNRQFLYSEIVLADEVHNLDPSDPKIEEKIKEVLENRVKSMIREARSNIVIADGATEEDDLGGVPSNDMEQGGRGEQTRANRTTFRLKEPKQVLIRLRVDHTGFPAINQQRFGGPFVGQVANPTDILLFTKKLKKGDNVRAAEGSTAHTRGGVQQQIDDAEVEDDLNKINIEELVEETLKLKNKKMNILVEGEISEALGDFVMKKSTNAICDKIGEMVEVVQKELIEDASLKDVGKGSIAEHAAKVKDKNEEKIRNGEKVFKGTTRRRSEDMMDEDDDEELIISDSDSSAKVKKAPAKRATKATAAAKGTQKTAAASRGKSAGGGGAVAETNKKKSAASKNSRSKSSMSDDDNDGDEVVDDAPAPRKTSSRAAAITASAKAKKNLALSDDESDYNEEDAQDYHSGNSDDEDQEEVAPAPKKKAVASRAAAKPKATAAKAPSKKNAATSRSKKQQEVEDIDESDDDVRIPPSTQSLGFTSSLPTQDAGKKRAFTGFAVSSTPTKRAHSAAMSNDWD